MKYLLEAYASSKDKDGFFRLSNELQVMDSRKQIQQGWNSDQIRSLGTQIIAIQNSANSIYCILMNKNLLGSALWDFYKSPGEQELITWTHLTEEDLLISYFFRTHDEMPAIEQKL